MKKVININTIYNTYSDDGHGWMAVKRDVLNNLGIENKISRCSYQKGKTVYLEEDGDLSLFFKTFKDQFGIDPRMKHIRVDGRSPIRSYANFKSEGCHNEK